MEAVKGLEEQNAKLERDFVEKESNEKLTIEIEPKEMRNVLENMEDKEYLARKALYTQYGLSKYAISFPVKMDEYTYLKDLTLDENDLCYYYKLVNMGNEWEDPSNRDEVYNILEEFVLNSLFNSPDPKSKVFANLCAMGNVNLKWDYEVGKQHIIIQFSPNELKQYLNK